MAAVHAILRHNGEKETNGVRRSVFSSTLSVVFNFIREGSSPIASRSSSTVFDRCRFLFEPAWNEEGELET